MGVQKSVTKSKSLIIGDSIVRGMRLRNVFSNVDIDVNPGKKMTDICNKLESTLMDEYHSAVIYAGGNDAHVRTPLDCLYRNLKKTVELLRQSECYVYVCTVCARQGHNSHRSGSPRTARHGSNSWNPRYNRTLHYA